MKDVRIIKATQSHVDGLRGRLRRSDCGEVLAATGLAPDAGLERSFSMSCMAWAVVEKAEVIAMFGVGASSLSGTGSPWLLGTDALVRQVRGFIQHSREYIDLMRQRFPNLVNWVDARNAASVRWLGWCGFTVEEPVPFGPFGLPFHKFHMGGGHVYRN
ncbi:hypothetical protein N1030_17575 [Desulfovibrio mangrovi]|uniref:hypothetical protein n=1 Tax=Desulfovibrio mangrovi TaxID=2976983 RepID=UPI0022463871|nr:hypothetical protein [Desulfovibrio mangrovi]UZP67383.1 hypothetical protein N1030_17575 [Desulfovibrio mangrovi]